MKKLLAILFAVVLNAAAAQTTTGSLGYISQPASAWDVENYVLTPYEFGYDETNDEWRQGDGVSLWPQLAVVPFIEPPPAITYVDNAVYPDAEWYHSSGTTNSSGVVTFYLTDTHTSGGDAVFPNEVLLSSVCVKVDSPFAWVDWSTLTVSGDMKSATCTVKVPGLVNLLTGVLAFNNASSGVSCTLSIQGR